jgi:hypothetical protein
LGQDSHGFECRKCGGAGWVSWEDVIVPWVVALLIAGIALSLGEWLWHLFAK